jgi:hypothetical protein
MYSVLKYLLSTLQIAILAVTRVVIPIRIREVPVSSPDTGEQVSILIYFVVPP